jgi:hypothetical protein
VVGQGQPHSRCIITNHPLGHELRVYVGGGLRYSRVHRALADAEAEAAERRREVLERGWTPVDK